MPGLSISINARQRSIIYALLEAEERITLNLLAKRTGLTSRIIRYNLDTVRAWFRNQGVPFTSRPGFGIEIEANRQTRRRLLALIEKYGEDTLILSRAQRQRISLFELLVSRKPITYHNLASNEGISRSTIVHDMGDIKQWLDSHNMLLQRSPNKGAFVVGSEMSRRVALMNVIREELGEKKWYALWYQPDLRTILDKSMPPNMERFIKELPLDASHHAVTHIENMIGRNMALYSRVEMMVYLALTIKDLLHERRALVPLECDPEIKLEPEVARVILSDIARRYRLTIPEPEVNMLAVFLLGAKWEETRVTLVSGAHKNNFTEMYPLSLRYVHGMIAVCARQLHPLLLVDEELIAELARHLEPVLHRLKYDLPILNENLEEIKASFPEVFRTASLSVSQIEAELGIVFPPEEIAYLVMYLVAALNRLKTKDRSKNAVLLVGDGVRAKIALLRARLEYEFSTLQVVGVMNGFIEDPAIYKQAELVLSLIPIEIPGMKTLQVSPFLKMAEKKIIQNWLIEQEETSRKLLVVPSEKPDLVNLLVPRHIIFSQTQPDWRAAVKLASQPLLDGGLIMPDYINAMIGLIEQYGPYMLLAPGVIILHARPVEGVNALCLSMLVLEKPIQFGEAPGEMVDIAFVLGAIDDHSHLNALFQLSNLISQSDFRDALRRSTSPADVIRAIWAETVQRLEA